MLDEAAAHWKHAAKKEQALLQRAETRITDPDRRDSGAPIEYTPRRKSEKASYLIFIYIQSHQDFAVFLCFVLFF